MAKQKKVPESLETGILFKETETEKFIIKGNRNYFELYKNNVRIFIDANSNIAKFKKDCKKYVA